jgi:ribosomal protein S18 acetylase RimI-like enzyme
VDIIFRGKTILIVSSSPFAMENTGTIRRVKSDDLDELLRIEQCCFPGETSYSRRQLQYLILKANSSCFVETDRGCIRGYIIILYRKKSCTAGIETVNVDPCFKNQGIGKNLLIKAEQEVKQLGIKRVRLEVSTANKAACALYEHHGYKRVDVLKNYYQYNHHGSYDAFRMMKEI